MKEGVRSTEEHGNRPADRATQQFACPMHAGLLAFTHLAEAPGGLWQGARRPANGATPCWLAGAATSVRADVAQKTEREENPLYA